MMQEYLILAALLLALYASTYRYKLSKKTKAQTPPFLVPVIVLFGLAVIYQIVMIIISLAS